MKTIAIVIICLIVSVAVFIPYRSYGADDTIYGCYKKENGQLRIVGNTQCRPDELSILWNNSDKKSSPGQGNIKVLDADGHELGIFVNDESGATEIQGIRIFVPSLSRTTLIDKTDGDISDGSLFFDDSKCGGTPYIMANYQYQIIKVWGKYFTSQESSLPVEKTYGSQGAYQSTCWPYGGKVYMVPAMEVTTILPFSLPVKLPLRFEY